MGKVIQMAGWRSRKPNQDPRAGLHVRTTTDEQEEVLKSVKALLVKSIQADQDIYTRPTVQERETAAIDSLGFHMQAVDLAKSHGITIRRRGPGVAVPKIYEVIAFGQILTVK